MKVSRQCTCCSLNSLDNFGKTDWILFCRLFQIKWGKVKVTLAGMCSKYGEIYLLFVGTIRQTLTVINVAVLRALVTEVLRPTKEQNVTHLVKNNTVRCFEIPALCLASSEWHVVFEKFQQHH